MTTIPPCARGIETLRYADPVPYAEALRIQVARRDQVERGLAQNTLMLLRHPPTFTLGRKADDSHLLRSREELAALGIEVCEADRGGDVTYHGPGQLVAYPILRLADWRLSVDWYLRQLEEVIIATLAHYGLRGERLAGFTGVWVDGAKVAAIGIGVHCWVTYHGIAINVDPNMEHWGLIVPCGIPDKPVTSLKRLLNDAPTVEEVDEVFENAFRDQFA